MATTDTQGTARLEPARRRARSVKWTLTAAAVTGFLATVLLARAGHPGTATTSSGTQATNGASEDAVVDESQSDDDLFGGASIAPQTQGSGSVQVGTRSS